MKKADDNTFTCDKCGQTFTKGWTDAEAEKEAEQFSGVQSWATVCDDCYSKLMKGVN